MWPGERRGIGPPCYPSRISTPATSAATRCIRTGAPSSCPSRTRTSGPLVTETELHLCLGHGAPGVVPPRRLAPAIPGSRSLRPRAGRLGWDVPLQGRRGPPVLLRRPAGRRRVQDHACLEAVQGGCALRRRGALGGDARVHGSQQVLPDRISGDRPRPEPPCAEDHLLWSQVRQGR